MRRIDRPEPGEYAPYVKMYLDRVPDDGRVLDHLEASLGAVSRYARALGEERLLHRYAPGKWTIKEILLHLSDDERIYVYRALRFARGDETELPGFEQDPYVLHSGANDRPIDDLLAELGAVRRATLAFFAGLPDEALRRGGVANGHRMTVRAIAYHVTGHELHHFAVMKERYFPAP